MYLLYHKCSKMLFYGFGLKYLTECCLHLQKYVAMLVLCTSYYLIYILCAPSFPEKYEFEFPI